MQKKAWIDERKEDYEFFKRINYRTALHILNQPIVWEQQYIMRKKTNEEIYYEIRVKDFLENRISFCHWSGRNILKLKIVSRTNLIFDTLN